MYQLFWSFDLYAHTEALGDMTYILYFKTVISNGVPVFISFA